MGTWLLSGCRWDLDRGSGGLDRIVPDGLPTLINVVPSLASHILDRLDGGDRSLSRLRLIGCGGAAMDPGRYARFRKHGVEVIQGYGCTETSPVICSGRPGSSRPGCVGPIVSSWEHRIVDGRLHVRGPSLMTGYLEDPIATAAKISTDGWFDTGDLVEIEPDGQFRVLGRADDVIVLDNGYKINPTSIEQALSADFGFEYVVVMNMPPRLIVGVQSVAPELHQSDWDRLERRVRDFLPPSTRFVVHQLDPPLSSERGELTIKGTPKADGVRRRFMDEVH